MQRCKISRYLIEHQLENGNKFWTGKDKTVIEANERSSWWEVLTYGYKTPQDAQKGIGALKRFDKRLGEPVGTYVVIGPLTVLLKPDELTYEYGNEGEIIEISEEELAAI